LPKIYILLPVHNRLEQTRSFIESLCQQTYVDYRLILIDDGSVDGTAEYVKDRIKDLVIITGQGNWFWGGGLHQGYLWLRKNKVNKEDVVLIINNDTEFSSDFLEKGMSILFKMPQTLLLAQAYGKDNANLIESGVYVDWRSLNFRQARKKDEINCLSTRGLFLRVGDFFDIGGFHPFLLPHYLADYEFTIRANHKGYTLITDPELSLIVDESSTGIHKLGQCISPIEFYKNYFSIRSADNPFFWFTFVAMACPWPWKAVNLLRVLYSGVGTLIRVFLQGANYHRKT